MTLEIHVLIWERHKNVADLNRLMGPQLFPLDNWILNLYKQMIKCLHSICLCLKSSFHSQVLYVLFYQNGIFCIYVA